MDHKQEKHSVYYYFNPAVSIILHLAQLCPMWFPISSVVLVLLAVTTSATNLERQTHQQRGLKEANIFSMSSSCQCKSTSRPCLFIHGELNGNEEKELQTSSKYFGDMTSHAPCCSSIKYVSLDTNSHGWTDGTLQETVCKHALSMSTTSDVKEKIIKDTILVTYSMGVLILAGAVANEKCSIETTSTSWVSMSAPMLGTLLSNAAQDVCTHDGWRPFRKVFLLVGQCPVNTGIKSLAYMGGIYSTIALNEEYKKAQKAYRDNVQGAMCSNGYLGIASKYQSQYMALATYVNHGTSEHDGFVTFESCRGGFPATKFDDKPTSAFYVTTCNHADTAFLTGNAYFSNAMEPVQWFECLL
ncbi:hypothetical protein KXD40_003346 [Peronospora effusa]|uniref:Uncharacterized protein n=1 Tax=Peronospora effusa TaxID=542832 RepID=A0A3M6V9P6_9STRA|nr:hypothetical protein DD238_007380 [Peronospora effusa]RQM13224.1 hypothetical protein DD237_007764 [Peronospora effusa]UIZ29769.1 hypothetical protein KXD40_003346 [Peronospora effusa]CAI5702482.1 unnamed protein product [Peronospora effusa]